MGSLKSMLLKSKKTRQSEALDAAYDFMVFMHWGQKDKKGKPYYLHPLRVGRSVEALGDAYVMTGFLHDVVEDTEATLADLKTIEIPAAVIKAVDALTRRKNEDYQEFIERAAKNKIAAKVKIADILDNLRPGGTASLRKRYRKALYFLLGFHYSA